jgi:hypothetical protein
VTTDNWQPGADAPQNGVYQHRHHLESFLIHSVCLLTQQHTAGSRYTRPCRVGCHSSGWSEFSWCHQLGHQCAKGLTAPQLAAGLVSDNGGSEFHELPRGHEHTNQLLVTPDLDGDTITEAASHLSHYGRGPRLPTLASVNVTKAKRPFARIAFYHVSSIYLLIKRQAYIHQSWLHPSCKCHRRCWCYS